jgi:drug/metabolite transporter (DMT)-like permease
MVFAGLAFTVMIGFVKVARAEMSVVEVVFWRGLFAVPAVVLLAWGVPWRLTRPGLFLVRAVCGFSAMFGFFYAAKGLAVTDHTLIGKLQPLVIAALAPLLLGKGEGAGAFGWVLIAVGFVGSALLIAPELQVGSLYGLAAAGATVGSGLAHMAIRRLTARDAPAALVLWFQGFVVVVAAVGTVAWTGGLPLPPPHLWGALAGAGASAALGQVLMTRAYSFDRAPLVAAAGYTTPVWAVLIDVVAWGAYPGWNALLGGALVMAAGLLLLLRR